MRFPFDNKYAPFTDCIGFIQCDVTLAAEKLMEWVTGWKNESFSSITCKSYSNQFSEVLELMQPFDCPEKICLFECADGWTGYIENRDRTETGRITIIARFISDTKESIAVQAWPKSNGNKTVNGWGGGGMQYSQGANLIRNIFLSDQDKWELDFYGEPLPFEEIETYKERFVKNKFTPQMLQRYLLHFGIDFFNDDFYMPTGSKAYIIEMARDKYDHEECLTLSEMRRQMKYE